MRVFFCFMIVFYLIFMFALWCKVSVNHSASRIMFLFRINNYIGTKGKVSSTLKAPAFTPTPGYCNRPLYGGGHGLIRILYGFVLLFFFFLRGVPYWVWAFSMFSCLFQSCLAFWSPRYEKKELVCVLLVHWFVYLMCAIFCMFVFHLVACFGCGLWLWHTLGFSYNVYSVVFFNAAWQCLFG